MKTGLLTASSLMLAAMASALSAQTASPRVFSPRESSNAPQIDLWLDEVQYNVGERIAPHFESEPGAFVTIVRVTSDGDVRVLYPQRPRDQREYERAQLVNDRVPYSSLDRRFEVYESEGMGFVFAIASFSKFNYGYFTAGNDWSLNHLASIRYGDPFEIVRRFADRTLGDGSDFAMDYVSYQVYNDGPRSRYASRYNYNTYDDYYDSCLSAFGYGYSLYCQPFYQEYPIIIASNPRAPRTNQPTDRHYAGKHIHPRVGDPMVHGSPSEPQPAAEGRLPNNDAAAEARRERLLKSAAPRDRGAPGADTRPLDAAPRIYRGTETTIPDRPRTEPQRMSPPPRQEMPRSEPVRIDMPQRAPPPPRVEVVRPMPASAPPPRVEVRNEPRVEVARPAPAPPPPPPAPAKKD
jgi:hypothetical protein